MIKAIDRLPGRKTMTERVVKKMMQVKTFEIVKTCFLIVHPLLYILLLFLLLFHKK